MSRSTFAVGALLAIAGCGDGADKTRRELGSSTADTATLTSSARGDVPTGGERDGRDSSARAASELRLRVRDRDALDPSQVRKQPKAKKPKHD